MIAQRSTSIEPTWLTMKHLIRALRPQQWPMKQIFVLACLPQALYFQGIGAVLKLGIVFCIFCAIAGAAYLVNDVQDVEADRLHPVKKNRPIASGHVSVALALSTACLLTVTALAVSLRVGSLELTGIVLLYIIISQIYNAGMKHTPVADVILVGSLYAVRTASGFVMLDLYTDGWYSWVALAGMLGCCAVLVKRMSEIKALGGTSSTRRTLVYYSQPGRLDRQYMATSAVTSIVFVPASYVVSPLLCFCSVLVVLCFRRLWKLAQRIEVDIHPIELVVKDWTIRGSVVVFALAFGYAILNP